MPGRRSQEHLSQFPVVPDRALLSGFESGVYGSAFRAHVGKYGVGVVDLIGAAYKENRVGRGQQMLQIGLFSRLYQGTSRANVEGGPVITIPSAAKSIQSVGS